MPSTASAAKIRDDFDAIAALMPAGDRLSRHEARLLTQLPTRRGIALEIGCGTGQLARRLAGFFDRVVAIDFSDGMIGEAKRRTAEGAAIDYVQAEMFDWLDGHPNAYDCIVTVATLHHVDLGAALRAISASLKRGGRLLVVDLLTHRNLFVSAAAWAVAPVLAAASLGRKASWKLRRAFHRHGRNETYLPIDEVERVAADALPGARVRGHLLWRYSIAWDKP